MTSISWTDETWNPTIGCSIVSPGCTNCYAMKMANRIQHLKPDPNSPYYGSTKVVNGKAVWTGKLAMASDATLLKPLHWKKPRRIFVNSMSDLFHDDVPDEWIDKVFAVMALCPLHTFQIFTKRSKRMREYMDEGFDNRSDKIGHQMRLIADNKLQSGIIDLPLPNVWLGVSCEDQTRADERIPDLLATPAAVRFVSAEPLLGPIDFLMLHYDGTVNIDALSGSHGLTVPLKGRGPKLDWIIAGSESGNCVRPAKEEWFRSIKDQAVSRGTAFFLKQYATASGNKIHLPELDGKTWQQYPEGSE